MKTIFIASFPDLSIFDFSKTGIKTDTVDSSDYFFNSGHNAFDDMASYIKSLKNKIGTCDIVFVPLNKKIIKSLLSENIKCIVLYPDKSAKDCLIDELKKAAVEEDYLNMLLNSWNYFISKFENYDYEYKYVMTKNDKIINVLQALLNKREELGIEKNPNQTLPSEKEINDIFKYCLLSEDEVTQKNSDKTYCEGIKYDYLFSRKRLKEKRKIIEFLIDTIKNIDDGISFLDMNICQNGKKWTNDKEILEKMVALGISSDILIFPFPHDFDKIIKGGYPYVIKRATLVKNSLTNL